MKTQKWKSHFIQCAVKRCFKFDFKEKTRRDRYKMGNDERQYGIQYGIRYGI
jgi:hypothetical protein